MTPGETTCELALETDPVTARKLWRLTTRARNNVGTYHLNTGFTACGRYTVFRRREGTMAGLVRADLHTGQLTIIAAASADAANPHPLSEFVVMPARSAVATTDGGSIRLYNLMTREETVLVRQVRQGFQASSVFATADGTAVGYVLSPELPHKVVKTRPYDTAEFDAYIRTFGGMPSSLRLIDLATGRETLVHEHPQALITHIQPNPADPNLWLLNLDLPPLFGWMGDHGHTSRAWLLDRRSGALRPVPTRNANQFQMHSTWSADGRFIYYHGRDRDTGFPIGQNGGGHYIGAAEASPGGRVAWERVFPFFHYGHVGSHTRRNTIVIDSLVTPDLLLEIDFAAAPDANAPAPMTILGRHGSAVGYGVQGSHPHAQVSPDGRCLVYNRAGAEGGADVCALWLTAPHESTMGTKA